jgi:hypothetical protein
MSTIPATAVSPSLYSDHMNSPRVALLISLLDVNAQYERRLGTERFPVDGKCILDFLSGYCDPNAGLTPEMAISPGNTLPPGSFVHARLVTQLDSATTQKGEEGCDGSPSTFVRRKTSDSVLN